MLKKNTWRLGAVAVAVAATLALGSTPALADPSGFKALAGSGSDTTQDVLSGLGTAVSSIGSYDATGSSTIQTKAGGPTFNRPNGSTAGIQALSASINSTGTKLWQGTSITGQLDFARSSSGPSATFPGSNLTFVPYARDAVTYAVNAGSSFPRNLPLGSAAAATANPNALTLWNIYHCTRTTYLDGAGDPVTIRPLIPQAGSGTRSFWLGRVGLTEATIPGCVTDLSNTVQEHNGTKLTGAGDIVPFSIAQYVAQGNHGAILDDTGVVVAERRANIALGAINGFAPMVVGANGAELNGDFPVNRLVYNVVATSRLSDPAIAAAFVGASSSVCQASAVIRQFGFATIANCGATTTTSGYYL
jgi:hypothetical protein